MKYFPITYDDFHIRFNPIGTLEETFAFSYLAEHLFELFMEFDRDLEFI